jgi:hypothetical protein
VSRQWYGAGARTEISLRDELINTLDGAGPEISKAQLGILRKMRRDTLGNLIPCVCVNSVTHEPERDHYCPFCLSEGNYWDETYVEFYRWEPESDVAKGLREQFAPPGTLNVPIKIFYIKYSRDLTLQDRVIELMLDEEGEIATPRRRRAIYRMGTLYDARSDNGRIEYWKVVGFEDKILQLNAR